MDTKEKVNYYIEQSKATNEYTFALEKEDRKLYILGKYHPKRVAIKMIPEDLGNKETAWILIGFGFGYITRELMSAVGDGVRILVYEPDKKFLDEQMKTQDYSDIQKTGIQLICGDDYEMLKEKIDRYILDRDINNVKVIILEGYDEFYIEECKKVIDIINVRLDQLIINFNTVSALRTKSLINTIRNRKSLLENYDILALENYYKDIPALIVSAGPSLQKNIQQIKNFRGVIFVLGRTITPVMEQGVKPDFVACVDTQDIIYETFGKYKEYDIPLLALAESNWKVIRGAHGPKYIMHNTHEVNKLLGMHVNPILNVSGSVATLCVSSAYFMGCNPIMFIGQDLAYTDNKLHSEITISESENRKSFDNEGNQEVKIKGYYGGTVYTNSVMYGFLMWFEEFVKENKQAKYINATEGGAYINGAEHIPFKEAIERYCKDVNKPMIKHKLLEQDEKVDMDKRLRMCLYTYEKMYLVFKKIKKLYIQLQEYEEKKQKADIIRVLNKITKGEKELTKLNKDKLIEMLMEDIGIAISCSNASKEPINETEDELKKRKIRLNYETYEELENECKRIINILRSEMNKGEELES